MQLPSPRGVDHGKVIFDEEKKKPAAGWRSRGSTHGKSSKNIMLAAPVLEKPDGMPAAVSDGLDGLDAYNGAGSADANSAGIDAHMQTLNLTDAPEFYDGGNAKKFGRYSQAVRSAMDERQNGKA